MSPFAPMPGGGWATDAAAALGLNLADLADDTSAEARARVLRWMGPSIRTRATDANPEGNARRDRVAHCGSLYAARCGEELGVAHKWCRDRMCPGCMARRQRTEGALLRTWVRGPDVARDRVLFVTLTQIKLDADHEDCAAALARLHGSRRAVFNTKTKANRELRKFFAGGIWFTEITWSYRGKENRDGSRVRFNGWHPHLHGLLELSEPPEALIAERGSYAAALASWRGQATRAVIRAWLRENPEASASGQKVLDLDEDRIAQVCKYPCKPFEFANPKRQSEAAIALDSKRVHDAFGSWRGWRKAAEALQEEPIRPPIEFGDATFQAAAVRAQLGGRVYFGRLDTIGVRAVDVLAGIQLDPRTFQRKARDAARETRSNPIGAESLPFSRMPAPRGPPAVPLRLT